MDIPQKRAPVINRSRFKRCLRLIERVLIAASIFCLLLDLGGYGADSVRINLQWYYIWAAALFVVLEFAGLLKSRHLDAYLKERRAEFTVMAVVGCLLLAGLLFGRPAFLFGESGLKGLMAAARLYIIILAIIVVVRVFQLFSASTFRPAQMIIFSFASIIILGAFLLASPQAAAVGKGLPIIDALFTSTSATCVTGLIVRDTGGFFSFRGQVIILALIQAGGLGIMTFTTFFAIAFGRGMGVREARAMTDMLDAPKFGTVGILIIYILLFTLAVEAVGVLLFYTVFSQATGAIPGGRMWSSIFHSISSFCNAGFSLNSTSFIEWVDNVWMVLLVSALVIIGGLGFTVNQNIMSVTAGKLLRRRKSSYLPTLTGRISERLSLQTKIVLSTSLALVVVGALGLYFTDVNGPIGSSSGGPRVLGAFFQSVTARTAGFNTVDIASLDQAPKLQLIMLMFIGASPGSTGGGIKTVTFAVLLLGLITIARGESNVRAFKRTLPRAIVNKVLALIFISLMYVLLATIALSILEASKNYDFIDILFEIVSAFATVGLSTITSTSDLSSAGKIVIIITMFVGRLGPLTMVLAMGARAKRRGYDYPREKVMIG